MWAEVAIVSGNFPIKQDVLHLRSFPNVMNNQVPVSQRRFGMHQNADMRRAVTQLPSDQITRRIIISMQSNRQSLLSG